jgi:PAS domain S-box-containing protein
LGKFGFSHLSFFASIQNQMNYESPVTFIPASADGLTNSLSAELLLAVFEAVPDALYLFNSENVLVKANTAAKLWQADYGRPLTGTRCCDMFWRSEGADVCVVDRALQSGERVEVEIQSGIGGNRPTILIVQPLSDSQAIVIARDISELRLAEAEAIAQRSFMASVADLTPDAIYALNRHGRITWMNKRAEADDLLMLPGRLFIEFIAEDCREAVLENLRLTLEAKETESEVRAVSLDDSIRHVEAHTAPLWKDGEVVGALAFLRDVTERKQAQERLVQSDKLRAVGELAAGVAHNLNNSLTVIQGRAQLLLMSSKDESVVKSLTVITKAVEEGAQTLRRILEFARRDSTQEFAPVELGELLTSSIEIARPKWQRKSVQTQIDVRIECHEPVYVLGDLAEMREVVLNLIFNAVDAMPEGGTMELGTRAELEGGCFWVADTGVGMAPETAAHIFEPFFTTKGQRGTGLGLSASHGIITRHKGEIVVVSEAEEGTRFEVRLPIYEKRTRPNNGADVSQSSGKESPPQVMGTRS